MSKNFLEIIDIIAVVLFAISFIISFLQNKKKTFTLSIVLTWITVVYMATILILIWIITGRPPMRTIGETRLWYAFFLPLLGGITYSLWRYRWFVTYSLFTALVFLCINLFKPELFVKQLPPALQSAWFVPHVIVYMLGYSLLAASAIISVYQLVSGKKSELSLILKRADTMVYSGFSMISMGLIFGALWAKVAWGTYWAWDPKETWALITWFIYLIYIHFRLSKPNTVNYKIALYILIFAFVVMLMAWMGIKFLPSAQSSIHVYG